MQFGRETFAAQNKMFEKLEKEYCDTSFDKKMLPYTCPRLCGPLVHKKSNKKDVKTSKNLSEKIYA